MRTPIEPTLVIESSEKQYGTNLIQKCNNIQTDTSSFDESSMLIDPSFNIAGNYTNYITSVLTSILSLKKNFSSELASLQTNQSKQLIRVTSENKKILLLDLDETLLHADFQNYFFEHDAVITFTSNSIQYSVGIMVRPGAFDFLNILSEQFEIYAFTASSRPYAEAVVNFFDPEGKIFKRIFTRNNCLNLFNRIYIKDLSTIFDIDDIGRVVLVDNSFYSFMNNISNGVLINSFYGDKSDLELYSVMNYLIGFVSKAEDVREVNEQFFNFKSIMQELQGSDINEKTNMGI